MTSTVRLHAGGLCFLGVFLLLWGGTNIEVFDSKFWFGINW